ncbi:hypothetical protein AB0M13_13385 [Nocardia fluminea]|uniref:hypothetical protein n=1 Tax=Nocardia fluminea TaxID=134984 RepID=UPI0034357EEA
MSATFDPAEVPDEQPVIMPDRMAAEVSLPSEGAECLPPDNVVSMPSVESSATAPDGRAPSYEALAPLTPEQADMLRMPPMFWPPAFENDPERVQFGQWFGTGGAQIKLWKDVEINLGGSFAPLALLSMVIVPTLIVVGGAKVGLEVWAILLTAGGAMLGIVILVVVFLLLGQPRR